MCILLSLCALLLLLLLLGNLETVYLIELPGKQLSLYEPTSVNLKHVCLTLWFLHIKTPQRTELRIDKLLLWQINDTQVFRENNGMNN